MELIIENGSVTEIAKKHKAEAAVIRKFGTPKNGESFGEAFWAKECPKDAPYKNAINVYVSTDSLEALSKIYKTSVSLAEEAGVKSVLIPLFGADCRRYEIKKIWTDAVKAIKESNSDVKVILVIGKEAENRISEALSEAKIEEKTNWKFNGVGEGASGQAGAPATMLITMRSKETLDAELDEAKPITDALTEAFAPYLEKYFNTEGRRRGITTINRLSDEILGSYMAPSTASNILSRNRAGNVKKRNIIMIAMVLGLNLNEVQDILEIGGFSFSGNDEDTIFRRAFIDGWNINDDDDKEYLEEILRKRGCGSLFRE